MDVEQFLDRSPFRRCRMGDHFFTHFLSPPPSPSSTFLHLLPNILLSFTPTLIHSFPPPAHLHTSQPFSPIYTRPSPPLRCPTSDHPYIPFSLLSTHLSPPCPSLLLSAPRPYHRTASRSFALLLLRSPASTVAFLPLPPVSPSPLLPLLPPPAPPSLSVPLPPRRAALAAPSPLRSSPSLPPPPSLSSSPAPPPLSSSLPPPPPPLSPLFPSLLLSPPPSLPLSSPSLIGTVVSAF